MAMPAQLQQPPELRRLSREKAHRAGDAGTRRHVQGVLRGGERDGEYTVRSSDRPTQGRIQKRKKMKLTWNKKNSQSAKKRPFPTVSRFPNLPFDQKDDGGADSAKQGGGLKEGEVSENQEAWALASRRDSPSDSDSSDRERLDQSFQAQGDKLAEDGKYREALRKWEAALTLTPKNAVLHKQKAQVLLEIGDAWSAVKAATRATELDPSWAEAWLTLGRAKLNFGEPDSAIQSFDSALPIKPECEEAQGDRRTALNLVKRRKQLHPSGLSNKESHFMVNDKFDTS